MRAAAGLSLAMIALAPLATQSPVGDATVVTGQVLEAATAQPVADGLVQLQAVDESEDLSPIQPSAGASAVHTLTDGNGRFLFRGVRPGRYRITTTVSGYLPAEFGQGRALGPGIPLTVSLPKGAVGLTIRMWRAGSISGILRDPHGEPAIGVPVRSFRMIQSGPHDRFTSATFVTTDDQGRYHFTDLIPGEYLIGVVVSQQTVPMAVMNASLDPASGSAVQVNQTLNSSGAPAFATAAGFRVGEFALRVPSLGLIPPPPTVDGRLKAYRSVFYPGVADPSQATAVTIAAGDDQSGLNFQTQLQPTVAIRGAVTGPAGGSLPFLGIRLLSDPEWPLQSEGLAEVASTATDAEGKFTLLGVPPGNYRLKIKKYPRSAGASSNDGTLWSSVPISVGGADINDLAIEARAGLSVSGRVEFRGKQSKPAGSEIERLIINLVVLDGQSSTPPPPPAQVQVDGTFVTPGYPAGAYLVGASRLPTGWRVHSIVAGAKDVTLRKLELSTSSITDVTVILTDQATSISGSVAGVTGLDTEIVVFPADPAARRESGFEPRHSRSETVREDGTFVIQALPPGEYLVAAVPAADATNWRQAKNMEKLLPFAQRVRLNDGGTAHVTLKLGRLR